MRSPFPGMDPYLEGSEWSGIHGQLIAEIARQLAPRLRPRYVARMGKRFIADIDSAEENIAVDVARPAMPAIVYPHVGVADEGSKGPAGTALGLAPPLEVATVMPQLLAQYSVEIRDAAQHRLVTVIEVLSPFNKRSDGFEEYLERRSRYLHSTTHLLEIDLLRTGRRLPMRQALPPMPYFVFLSRSGRRPLTGVWPVSLRDPLPTVPVPLLPGDADVPLDLQQAFSSVYDQLGYDISIDYSQPPEVTLDRENETWADQLLRGAGRR